MRISSKAAVGTHVTAEDNADTCCSNVITYVAKLSFFIPHPSPSPKARRENGLNLTTLASCRRLPQSRFFNMIFSINRVLLRS